MTTGGPTRPMTYLITGGSGALGTTLTAELLAKPETARVIALARHEPALVRLKSAFPDPRLEIRVGDVRDRDRLRWAFDCEIDVVIHAAALKRVEICEADSDEAYKTNIEGTRNVVQLAMRANVPKVVVISSDKACSPETVYGATKAAAEALALGQNAWRGRRPTRISVVRYGNILNSTGAFLHTVLESRHTGQTIPVTDVRASRFWWVLEDAARFVLRIAGEMQGSEIWIPKLLSARVIDLIKAVAPDAPIAEVGMRGPEKLHEAMINATESAYTYELPDCYVLLPKLGQWWSGGIPEGAVKVPAGFTYSSDQQPLPVSVCV